MLQKFSRQRYTFKQIFFLQIVNKHLLSRSPLLKCIQIPFLACLEDVNNTYYQVIAATNISITAIKTDSFVLVVIKKNLRLWRKLLMQSPDWLDISKARHIFISTWCHTGTETHWNKKWWWKYFDLFRKSSELCLTWWGELHN